MSDTNDVTSRFAGAPAGLSIKEWARQVGIAYSSYYIINKDARPQQIRVGRRIIVIEAPGAWLNRMASCGVVPTRAPKTTG